MTAPRAAVRPVLLLPVLLLLLDFGALAAPRAEADPHELYEKAQEQLAAGHLEEASASLSRLRALIAKRPDWDPGGVFEKELLPPLRGRLRRLEDASRRLDAFAEGALENLKPPDLKKQISTVKDYTAWAREVIGKLRAERDQIVQEALADPEDRALLARTVSYARTERLLESEVLQRMAEAAGDDILGLLSGDPELETVLVRFRQLKQALMESLAEKEALERRLKSAGRPDESVLRALAAVVTDGASLKAGPGGWTAAGVADRFGRFLDDERKALGGRGALTPSERDALQARMSRYKRYNQVLVAAGLGPDQGRKLESLRQAVAALPVRPGGRAPATPGGLSLAIIVVLGASAAYLAWLSHTRGRRLAALRSAALPMPVHARPDEEPAAGRRVA